MPITIEQAIAEIENSGMYGNQVHQETLEWALIALKEKLNKNAESETGYGYTETEDGARRFYNLTQEDGGMLWRDTGVICPRCGAEYKYAYLEERLYAIKCNRCKTVTLITGNNSLNAATQCGIYAVPIDEYSEDCGDVLCWEFPVCEPPDLGMPGMSWDRHGDPTVSDRCTHFTQIYWPMEPDGDQQ